MAQLTEEQKKAAGAVTVPFLINLLIREGVKANVIPYLISQSILETNWFTSNAFKLNKNPGGISWNSNYQTRPGTSLGVKRPPSEGGNYVNFDNLEIAVKDWIRILNRNSKPIEARSLQDFAERAGQNGYFAPPTTTQQYFDMLKAQYRRINQWFDATELAKREIKNDNLTAGINPLFVLLAFSLLFMKN